MNESQLSESIVSVKGGVQKNLEQVGGKYALSWPVALTSYLWATFISVGFDRIRFDSSFTGWWLTSTIAHIILILVAIPIRKKFLPVTNRKSKPVTALVAFAFLGLIRSFLIGELSVFFGLAPTQEYGYRQITGLVSVTTGLAVTTILVHSIAERTLALRELSREREQLTAIQNQSEQLLEEKRQEVLNIIDESIRPSLEEINQSITTKDSISHEATEQTTKLISALIDERLRPISDSLHQPSAFLNGESNWSKVRNPIVRRNTKISVQSLISPFLITFIMSAVTISASIYYVGFRAVLIGPVIYLPFLLIAYLGEQLIPAEWKLNIWVALPLTSLAHTGAGFPSFYLINRLGTIYPSISQQLLVAVIGFTFISGAIALLRAMDNERQTFEKEFKQANEEAAAILANVNQRIWVNRKNVAQLLHGSVQASLTAANLRLRQGQLTVSELVKVREDIARAISALTDQDFGSLDLEGAFEDLIDLWDGVCDIEISVSPELVAQLTDDQTAGSCVNEFLKECVNNAIKHGQATEIDVQVTSSDPNTVEVRVLNNGQFKPENQAGLGTRILDEITISWTRKLTEKGIEVSGIIGLTPLKHADVN